MRMTTLLLAMATGLLTSCVSEPPPTSQQAACAAETTVAAASASCECHNDGCCSMLLCPYIDPDCI